MRAAVLGRPVSHSLSPLLHRAAYAALGLTDWTYDALDIGAEDLRVLLAGLGEEWRGFSVTMPCKQAAVDVADLAPTFAELLGMEFPTSESEPLREALVPAGRRPERPAAIQPVLRKHGEQLLSYARRMLELNDEVFSRMTDVQYEGHLVLGAPHDVVRALRKGGP